MRMNGFTFTMSDKDIFIKTELKNKTEGLARKILHKLEIPESLNYIKLVLYVLQRATCEIKVTSTGREYYEISGKDFGGRGSFVDDGNTFIIEL